MFCLMRGKWWRSGLDWDLWITFMSLYLFVSIMMKSVSTLRLTWHQLTSFMWQLYLPTFSSIQFSRACTKCWVNSHLFFYWDFFDLSFPSIFTFLCACFFFISLLPLPILPNKCIDANLTLHALKRSPKDWHISKNLFKCSCLKQFPKRSKIQASRVKLGFESYLHESPEMQSWKSYLTFLNLSSFILKVKSDHVFTGLAQFLGIKNDSINAVTVIEAGE